jgi:penicillin-binding protein 1A
MTQRYNQPLRALLTALLLFAPAPASAQQPGPADTEPWTIVPMPQASLVYARDGSLIGEIGKEIRTSVSIKSLPAYLPRAFVAVEDHRFYQHDGVDVVGIAGALKDNIFGSGAGRAPSPSSSSGTCIPRS